MELSKREKEVADMYCMGYTSKEIAEKSFTSVTTVETHKRHIFKKLNIHSVRELVSQQLLIANEEKMQRDEIITLLNKGIETMGKGIDNILTVMCSINKDLEKATELAVRLKTKTDYQSEAEVEKDIDGITKIIARVKNNAEKVSELNV